MAASKVTPESINYMIAHARLFAALLSNQLKLGVSSMVPHNRVLNGLTLQYRWMLRELPQGLVHSIAHRPFRILANLGQSRRVGPAVCLSLTSTLWWGS